MNREELIKNELIKTTKKSHYNGWYNRTTYVYHSYNINEINISGQRNPKMRIGSISKHVNFDNKKVIDFGCNVGAMLYHLDNIKIGLGFDYDEDCINVANNISEILEKNNQIVSIIKGDSYNELNKLISQINEPFTYWLDGHYSGGKTGFGFLEFPIMIELESILKRNINDEIIYIDDMRILENYSKTINKNLIIELVNKYKNNFNISYERSEFYKEDIMIIEY